jgi:hypothetical protein
MQLKRKLSGYWMKVVQRWVWRVRGGVERGLGCIFIVVDDKGVFCYFDGFPDDLRRVCPDQSGC